jgi:hypothetical protein
MSKLSINIFRIPKIEGEAHEYTVNKERKERALGGPAGKKII